MILKEAERSTQSSVNMKNYLPKIGIDDIKDEIITGLTSAPKYISSIYFYDSRGSELFNDITRLAEYYTTRTEKMILERNAPNISKELRNVDIVELGSGDCSKISILLNPLSKDAIESVRYIPVDISAAAIEESAKSLIKIYKKLDIQGIVADFTKQLNLLPSEKPRVFCFFGSTIGNLSRSDANLFIKNLSEIMQQGDILLLGLDMVKDKDILEKAYNDSKGITAQFNLNILNVVNNLSGTNFDLSEFEHLAFYNESSSRIEMHLKALKDLEISSPHLPENLVIEQGETIHTENSHKFRDEQIEDMANTAGLEITNQFTDEKHWFSLVLFHKR